MKTLTTILAAALTLCACTSKAEKAQDTEETTEPSVLVAYFSATGTTKAQAEAIAEAVEGTLYEITPAQIYTDADLDWRNEQSRTTIEMKSETMRPELAGDSICAADYSVVFVGFPNWWNQAPRIINTWIESQNLKGKTVVLFSTSGGSSIDNSEKQLKALYPEIAWGESKLLNCSAEEAAEWAKSVVK